MDKKIKKYHINKVKKEIIKSLTNTNTNHITNSQNIDSVDSLDRSITIDLNEIYSNYNPSEKTNNTVRLQKSNNIYDLFSRNQYKTLLNLVREKSDLLDLEINDGKTLIHYATITNNKKLINKLIEINPKQLLYSTRENIYLPHIALKIGHFNLFFYLIDKFVESSNHNLLFNSETTVRDFNIMTLTHSVIFKKDNDLLNRYLESYLEYIDWSKMYNGYTYLSLMIINNINNLSKIIDYIGKVLNFEKKIDPKILFFSPNGFHPLYDLLVNYYNQKKIINKIQTNSEIINKVQTSSKIINKIQTSIELIKKFINLYPEQINYSNFQNKTPIYYVGEENDIDMMKFLVNNKANLNHLSPLGYNNFCHNIMKKSDYKMVEYILDLDMNFNHIDSNNETPIFNLLRNNIFVSNDKLPNDVKKIQVQLISKLLEKTENWNLQNIYGQTIIHLLTNRSDIKSFYDILSTKFFDPNLKNKVGTSAINILSQTLIGKKKSEIEVKQEIEDFKELLVDNYIKTLSETDSIDIPKEIKTDCEHYNSNDPKKKKTACWLTTMNSLSKPAFTDIDKLSKNYRDIIYEDHQFAHYNLYNARDYDIYYYYILLIQKHESLGVPLNNNFDEKKSSDLSFINPKNISNIENLNYFQILVSNTVKHSSLYPLNIYWLNETNYMLPYNMVSSVKNGIDIGKKYIIIRINIIGQILHANILLIDTENNRIIRFEPQGGINKDNMNILDDKIFEEFKKDDKFKSYKYFKPMDYEPINGLQSLSQETESMNIRKGDINGFCVAWCIWFVEFYIQNSNNKLLSDSNFKILIPKLIKKLINSGYLISEYIRNYANYIHHKLVTYLINKKFPYSNIYYDKFTNQELDELYSHASKTFNDQI
jgi:hypothetical protein